MMSATYAKKRLSGTKKRYAYITRNGTSLSLSTYTTKFVTNQPSGLGRRSGSRGRREGTKSGKQKEAGLGSRCLTGEGLGLQE